MVWKTELGIILAFKNNPPVTVKSFHVKQIIIFGALCLALAQACVNVSASSPVEKPNAPNVSVSEKSVWIAHADAEFILRFDQHCTYEFAGQTPITVPAQVFQMDGGEWIAGWEADNYVRVNPATGITNAQINGRTYIGLCGHMVDDITPPAK